MKERRISQPLVMRCKLVLVGDVQCGKTAMLQVLAKDCYPEVCPALSHVFTERLLMCVFASTLDTCLCHYATIYCDYYALRLVILYIHTSYIKVILHVSFSCELLCTC